MHYMQFRRKNPEAPLMYEYGLSINEKLRKFYVPGPPEDCWLWKGALNKAGYGRIDGGNSVLAHRLAWQLHAGKEAPRGMVVMHSCDTPACVNPKHLSLGTQRDNVKDMQAKRRHVVHLIRGESHHSARLNERQVRDIRASSLGSRELADQYGVNRASIQKIRSRKTWKHIE